VEHKTLRTRSSYRERCFYVYFYVYFFPIVLYFLPLLQYFDCAVLFCGRQIAAPRATTNENPL